MKAVTFKIYKPEKKDIQTSKTTCCNKSGNFCTIVTGCPDVSDTPYIGAVVLYRVLHSLEGVDVHALAGVKFVALPGIEVNANETDLNFNFCNYYMLIVFELCY